MPERKTPEQHKIFAKKMKDGCSIRESMLTAGYSAKQANKGQKAISGKMLKALSAEGYKLAEFGKSLTTEMMKNIAIGRLATNAITGKDGGVMSSKTLGSHRDLNLWVPESQAGVIVISAPTQMIERKNTLLDSED